MANDFERRPGRSVGAAEQYLIGARVYARVIAFVGVGTDRGFADAEDDTGVTNGRGSDVGLDARVVALHVFDQRFEPWRATGRRHPEFAVVCPPPSAEP